MKTFGILENWSPRKGGHNRGFVLLYFIFNIIQAKTSKQYLFGKRDTTKKGEPLGKIIDMVIMELLLYLLLCPFSSVARN